MKFTRRQTLVMGAAALASMTIAINSATAANDNDHKELISKFTGGKATKEGKITLDLPEIAENGNTVPLSFSVDSPMTKDDHVKRVIVVADGNPRAGVATFNFTAKSGVAEASTRIRLAKTQNIIAVAEMSDGSYVTAKREVKVTIGGCGG